jgi:hypothetical protein
MATCFWISCLCCSRSLASNEQSHVNEFAPPNPLAKRHWQQQQKGLTRTMMSNTNGANQISRCVQEASRENGRVEKISVNNNVEGSERQKWQNI